MKKWACFLGLKSFEVFLFYLWCHLSYWIGRGMVSLIPELVKNPLSPPAIELWAVGLATQLLAVIFGVIIGFLVIVNLEWAEQMTS